MLAPTRELVRELNLRAQASRDVAGSVGRSRRWLLGASRVTW